MDSKFPMREQLSTDAYEGWLVLRELSGDTAQAEMLASHVSECSVASYGVVIDRRDISGR